MHISTTVISTILRLTMTATATLTIKLLIDKKKNKVLFAEAGKDFVDFLFNLLALPVGSVIGLLKQENMVGCLGNLSKSVESFSSTYMQPNVDRNSLLKPKTSTTSEAKKIFRCGNSFGFSECRTYVTSEPKTLCPGCRNSMFCATKWVGEKVADAGFASESSNVGYVMGGTGVTYMVMDDLVVKPIMSTISSITMLNKFNVKDVGVLEERVVELDMAERLKLLKESLQSARVLTNVFLRK